MRRVVVWLAVAAVAVSTAMASDETRQEALNAAGVFAALAYQCSELIEEPGLKQFAKDDASVTLQAGGYSPEEATSKTGEIFTALDANWQDTGMPEGMCKALVTNIRDNREKYRSDLAARR